MYEDLSAPTAATANVFAMAALAAREKRVVATVDIGGAYLNASMEESGVIVHMQLNKVMADILVKINPADGTMRLQQTEQCKDTDITDATRRRSAHNM